MKRLTWLIVGVIVLIALTLRLHQFKNRTPFDWDQNRDYGEVVKIASGQYIPLGPIAKGTSGGFYLGSLYYYALAPTYMLMDGAVSSLPITSIVIDALVAGLLYLLLYKPLGKKRSLLLAVMWTCTWFLIEWSRVSWNVALVPLWSLLTLYALYESIEYKSVRHFYLLALLAGLTIHIHVATIPVIPLLLIIFLKRLHFPLRVWIQGVTLSITPAIPLLLYDMGHGFSNLHLLKDFLHFHGQVQTPWNEMVIVMLTKLGKVVSGIFVSVFRDNIWLGLITLILALKSLWNKNTVVRLAGAMVVISSLLVVFLRDPGFPEYYLAPAYLALCIVFLNALFNLFPRRLQTIVYVCVAACIYLNLSAYTTETTGFSLAVKEQIVESLKVYEHPIDINYTFDPGREGGLKYLVNDAGIQLDPKSKTRVIITDKLNTPLYIDGELARDLTQIGNLRTALYIVQ